jgi:hypothetical protein
MNLKIVEPERPCMEKRGQRVRKNIKRREMKGNEVVINSNEFWVNIVDFLQQYWALIETNDGAKHVTVYFLNEGSGIFAKMDFNTAEIAEKALMQNGFKKYNDPLEKYQEYLKPPVKPYFLIRRIEGHRFAPDTI